MKLRVNFKENYKKLINNYNKKIFISYKDHLNLIIYYKNKFNIQTTMVIIK